MSRKRRRNRKNRLHFRFLLQKKERDGNDPVIVEFKAPDTKNLNAAADQLWN